MEYQHLCDLIKQIESCGEHDLAEKLFASIRRSMRLELQTPERVLLPTSSKWGGLPYLPSGVEWPQITSANEAGEQFLEDYESVGGPMKFILQLNLRELPFVPEGLSLPKSGVLTFFAANHKYGFPHTYGSGCDWVVFHVNESDGLVVEAPCPSNEFIKASYDFSDGPIEGGDITLRQYALRMSEFWQCDRVHAIQFLQANRGRDECVNNGIVVKPLVRALVNDWMNYVPLHIFGGYAAPLQQPIDDTMASYDGLLNEAVRLLLQIDSDENVGFAWQASGRGFFMMDDQPNFISDGGRCRTVLITQNT